jgi:alpha/beta superfamily hydrolase
MTPPARSETVHVHTGAGNVEVLIDRPATAAPRGVMLIAHHHPVRGGAPDHALYAALASVATHAGMVALRPFLRGVGDTDGRRTHGHGEADDMRCVAAFAEREFAAGPPVLCGVSFGAFVQTLTATRIHAIGAPVRDLVLLGLPVGRTAPGPQYAPPECPCDALVIHGECDETVPLAQVLDWARPQALRVEIVPSAGHLFEGRLDALTALVSARLAG